MSVASSQFSDRCWLASKSIGLSVAVYEWSLKAFDIPDPMISTAGKQRLCVDYPLFELNWLGST